MLVRDREVEAFIFFFNDTATTEIYPLSLHDALPILSPTRSPPSSGSSSPTRTATSRPPWHSPPGSPPGRTAWWSQGSDRKSTRLNSSHANISYAVFCLKKNNTSHCTACANTSSPQSP